MIVYFSKKSKNKVLWWLVATGILSVLLYMGFILVHINKTKYSTIQIIRVQDSFSSEFVQVQDKEGNTIEIDRGAFVASKKGVYYYPINCPKAKALSIKNMLYFKDKIDAERAGYKAYISCF